MQQVFDILMHLPEHLGAFVNDHGAWVYALLFGIVFCETGLVVTPFLPGDSLLFAVGVLAGTGAIRLEVAAPLMFLAAILGNTSNYHIGKFVGPRVFKGDVKSRFLRRDYLDRAHAFFEKHGGKAVTLGQFVPIVRTFLPFVAGAGAMDYRKFILFNVVGALAWVSICCGAGYFLGQFEVVRKNFSIAILAIIVVSLIPIVIEFVKSRRAATDSAPAKS